MNSARHDILWLREERLEKNMQPSERLARKSPLP